MEINQNGRLKAQLQYQELREYQKLQAKVSPAVLPEAGMAEVVP
jgi:hypothetical protein